MSDEPATEFSAEIRRSALPLSGPEAWDPVLERIGDARYVLIGEASHGTSEYYSRRAELTRRLIVEKGFSFVAVEGDWPDCRAVHWSVTGAPGAPDDPVVALRDFRRWPTWMWANTDVARFARWLRTHNADLPSGRRVGFFGLDVYSLWESLDALLSHLRDHDPQLVDQALAAYRCFEPYAEDPQTYARATRLVPSGCEPEVVGLLISVREHAREAAVTSGGDLTDLDARQNAEVLAGAERYYRAMVRGGPQSWNIRDHHMADTLDRLISHHGPQAKAVVWEHNTHIGDARATDMTDAGLVNVGQLVRERHAADGVILIGFGSYHGTVLAGDAWGAPARSMKVPTARPGSVEDLLHRALPDGSALFLFRTGLADGREADRCGDWSDTPLDHRAIGVVYQPDREKRGNYVPTVIAERYDAFLFIDTTHALTPLHQQRGALTKEEETWPTGQ
ncbi:erythromycin esterase family protein [Streptomyces sp. NPDC051320]|uniref:erythromycin esterase family protein n=1 Tax=Streptomyces sp. NPDC051320 TaxID=3154644 RepID=UPI0034404588